MNRIYQVTWNRARGMYMVVSELAKSRSKGSGAGGKRSKLFQPAAVLAVLLTFGVGGNAWAAVTIGTTDPGVSATVYTTDEVYTKIEVNAELEKKADLNTDGKVAAAVKADTADIATNATNDGNGKNIADTYATQESVNAALEKRQMLMRTGKLTLLSKRIPPLRQPMPPMPPTMERETTLQLPMPPRRHWRVSRTRLQIL